MSESLPFDATMGKSSPLIIAHEGGHHESVISVKVEDVVEGHGVAVEEGIPSFE